ncbi:MAG: copper-binding protein [Pirellulales bacterium]
MMKNLQCGILIALAALALIVVAGCGDRSPQLPTAPKEQIMSTEYMITGTVTAIGSDKKTVKLDHEDIPGLMKGMEMEFPVSDSKVIEGLSVGDPVEGRLQKSDELIITRLQKK